MSNFTQILNDLLLQQDTEAMVGVCLNDSRLQAEPSQPTDQADVAMTDAEAMGPMGSPAASTIAPTTRREYYSRRPNQIPNNCYLEPGISVETGFDWLLCSLKRISSKVSHWARAIDDKQLEYMSTYKKAFSDSLRSMANDMNAFSAILAHPRPDWDLLSIRDGWFGNLLPAVELVEQESGIAAARPGKAGLLFSEVRIASVVLRARLTQLKDSQARYDRQAHLGVALQDREAKDQAEEQMWMGLEEEMDRLLKIED